MSDLKTRASGASRRAAVKTLAGATMALLQGPSVAFCAPAMAQTALPDYSRVKPPANGIELLQNMKDVIEGHLLLDRSFYVEATLRRFFGGEKVSWGSPPHYGPNKIGGYVYDFEDPLRRADPRVGLNDDRTIRFDMSIGPDGRSTAVLVASLRTTYPRPDFADVEALFGKDWESEGVVFPLSRPNYQTPIAPHGNEQVIYRFIRDGVTTELSLSYAFDARVEYAKISMEN